jgi:hypothetical protein
MKINVKDPVSGQIENLEVNRLDNLIEPGWVVTLRKGITISIYLRNGIWKTKSGDALHFDLAQSIGEEISRSLPHRKPRPRLIRTALL